MTLASSPAGQYVLSKNTVLRCLRSRTQTVIWVGDSGLGLLRTSIGSALVLMVVEFVFWKVGSGDGCVLVTAAPRKGIFWGVELSWFGVGGAR